MTKKKTKKICLRDIIYNQLDKTGLYYLIKDKFYDKSSSWIDIYKSDDNPFNPKIGKQRLLIISFDYNGDNIQDIEVFEQNVSIEIDEANQEKIF